MLNLYNSLLDYFFYKKCYFCNRKAKTGLTCDKCFEKIKSTGFKKIKKIKGTEIRGYFFYKDEIQKLIRAIKYHNKKDLSGDIARIFVELSKEDRVLGEETEIIPVPLHPERQKERKYNQMELISEEISLLTGCRINYDLVKRIKNTPPQYRLSRRERRKNLKGAFKVFPENYSGKNLILIDDISTTGVTMEELITELRKNNIHNVTGLVIAFAS
jgi:competence protein ComFC